MLQIPFQSEFDDSIWEKKKRELQEPIKNLVWGLIPAWGYEAI